MDEISSYLERRQPAGFALFRCCDCEETFAELLVPLYEELQPCPYCESGPVQLVSVLEPVAG